MIFAPIIKFFKGEEAREAVPGRFSDFLIHASEEEKIAVFTEAAHKANEDQMRVFTAAGLKPETL
jgi:hypothetical protein